MKLKHLALGALTLLSAASASAANRPAGYVTVCSEGKTCSVAANTDVAFGRADKFFYKALSGSFVCSEATFGGRIAGGVNECSRPNGPVSSASSSRSSSAPSSSSSSARPGSSSSSYSSVTSSSAPSSSSSSSIAPPGSCPITQEGFSTLNGGTTGGGNAAPTTVATVAALKACATAMEARVCRVQGTITFDPFEEIMVKSNKTIIGVGSTGQLVNGGFRLDIGVNNVIIRNLTIRDSFIEGDWDGKVADNDGVQMDTARNIWIDHNRFSRVADGMIDSRKDTTNLTVSWNILENQNKAFGIGWTENVTSEITIHHNWLSNTHQRNPSADNILRAHLYNNVLENNAGYGNYARGGTNMVLENSVFKNTKDPHYYDTGSLVAIGNSYTNTTGQRESSGSSYSFFNPKNLYSYVLHPVSQVSELVKRCAGPRPELGQ